MGSTKNWMLDEVEATLNENLTKEELAKKLSIQKIEYGRICLAQLLAMGGQTRQTIEGYRYELDSELQKRIIELGGTPK